MLPPPLSPGLPPPAPCGNQSVALGLPGAALACRALLANSSADAWLELAFCAGCADAEGCAHFCSCFVGDVACTPLVTHRIIGHGGRTDNRWGSLLPISILVFLGGFMCQMYIKNNRQGAGGGLNGRGRPEEEGTELLGCMPRSRRRPGESDNPNEKMMPSQSQQRREQFRGGRVNDDDDGIDRKAHV